MMIIFTEENSPEQKIFYILAYQTRESTFHIATQLFMFYYFPGFWNSESELQWRKWTKNKDKYQIKVEHLSCIACRSHHSDGKNEFSSPFSLPPEKYITCTSFHGSHCKAFLICFNRPFFCFHFVQVPPPPEKKCIKNLHRARSFRPKLLPRNIQYITK